MENMIEPSEFDLVVIGTGLIESIVAAAASKAGHSVLQVDPASHYGGAWASLPLDELQAVLESSSSSSNQNSTSLLGNELAFSLYGGRILVQPTSPQLLESLQAYSLDVSPHLLYGAGPMISLLLGSGAHHYTEYKLLQVTVLRNFNSSSIAQPVPSTRAEIFRDKTLSPLQKRTLMRFIKGMAEAMEGKGPFSEVFKAVDTSENEKQQQAMLFKEFMDKEGLDLHLQRCLAHGVLLQHSSLNNNAELTCLEALELFKLYVESVGRYGIDAGPFLTPLYGCGELPQAFCRAAAVSGAVQILRCRVSDLQNCYKETNEDIHRSIGIEVELEENTKQVVKTSKLAAGPSSLENWIETGFNIPATVITHRCIAILDAPVEVDKAQALLVFPDAGPGGSTVWAVQLSHSTAVCPEGQSVVHVWCTGGGLKEEEDCGTAEEYLMPCLESLADCNGAGGDDGDGEVQQRPQALFAACFSLKTLKTNTSKRQKSLIATNVVLCTGPSADVTFASAVEEAKKCYWQLFPPEEGVPSTELIFPLDEAANHDDEDHDAPGNADEEEATTRPEQENASGGGGATYDSDDEALQALKAALDLIPSTTSNE